jgi:ParB/RepB/Spo0J family partition protein
LQFLIYTSQATPRWRARLFPEEESMARKSVAEAAAAAETDDSAMLGAAPPVTDAGPMPGPAQFEPEMSVSLLGESPRNPRKRFKPEAMRALEESVRAKGVVTPLLVRRRPGRPGFVYEIAAGHRRFRAAIATGRPTVPVLIRDMPDEEFLELLVMENDQREDVHALEEASGYQALLGLRGYDVAKIAARVGRSPKYVYDRLKLLELIPAAQKLFLDDRFTAGHAILLARLKPEDQKRAIDGNDRGLFQPMRELPFDPELEKADRRDPYATLKAVSVREFEGWIQERVRFEPAHVDAFLFPETAKELEAHADDKLGVILVTRHYQASNDVREAGKAKVFGENAWRRADGQEKSKACDWSRQAFVASGPGQGETLRVCINKDKCETHWREYVRARKNRPAAAASGGGSAKRQEQDLADRERTRRAAENEELLQWRWRKAAPAMLEALAAAVRKAPLEPTGLLATLLTRVVSVTADDSQYVPIGKTAEDLVRHLAFSLAASEGDQVAYQWGRERFAKQLKAFGIDAGKILNEAAPVEKAQTSAKPGKPTKGTCRKCGCREMSPCAGGCGWADGTRTRCTACFPPKLTSAAKGKKKARR